MNIGSNLQRGTLKIAPKQGGYAMSGTFVPKGNQNPPKPTGQDSGSDSTTGNAQDTPDFGQGKK